jgi:CRISPR-associated protein (cas_TM1812)
VPIIAEYMGERKEDVCVIAILPEGKDAAENFQTFKNELQEIGLTAENVTGLSLEGKSNGKNGIKLLLQLLDAIPDDTLVYSDITYNTKPMSAMVLCAMNLVEKVKDAEVAGIYYGEIPRIGGKAVPEKAALCDITQFKTLLDITNYMEQLEIADIRSALEYLLL